MATIAGHLGAVYTQTGSTTAMTNEACTEISPTQYQITAITKRYWDVDASFIVNYNGVPTTVSYTLQYLGGYIDFASDPGAAAVTVTGSYFTVSQVAGFFDWSIDATGELLDITDFGDAWRTYGHQNIKDFEVTANWYWGDSTFLTKLGSNFIVVCYVDTTGGSLKYYQCQTRVQGISPNCPVGEVIKETITFKGNGEFHYRTA